MPEPTAEAKRLAWEVYEWWPAAVEQATGMKSCEGEGAVVRFLAAKLDEAGLREAIDKLQRLGRRLADIQPHLFGAPACDCAGAQDDVVAALAALQGKEQPE